MNYEFATITHIDEVREAIKGREEFIEAKRDGFTVFNYMVNFPETFPPVDPYPPEDLAEANDVTTKYPNYFEEQARAKILRECRGLTFCNTTGKVIGRKFHKFFNVGEKEETRVENIPWHLNHWIEEKLDGSMITPVLVNGEIQWHTKMGKTEVADQVLPFIAKNPQYKAFAKYLIENEVTPIFEWCSPKQRIVIDHKEDRLVLLAARDWRTGKYQPRSFIWHIAQAYSVDVVMVYGQSIRDINKFIEDTRNLENREGYVVCFENGHKFKIKSDWYCAIHKTKDRISHERYVVELIADQIIDDIKPVLMEDDLRMVQEYEDAFTWRITCEANKLSKYLEEIPEGIDRKTFAVEYATKLGGKRSSIAFHVFGLQRSEIRLKVYQELINVLKKSVKSNRNFDETKKEFFPDIQYRGFKSE